MNKNLVKPYYDDGICPHCGIYKQWSWDYFANIDHNRSNFKYLGSYAYCENCKEYTIYYNEKLVYPKDKLLIKPNILFDKYKKPKKLFLEAVEISPISPRAGLTLARMCLESLTNEILQEHNEKISENFRDNIEKLHNLDIISLKLKNLLSSARIIGNKSTHNFNIIDTENEPNLEDAVAVLEAIDFILENMRIASEKEEKLSKLEEKVKKTKGSENGKL